MPHSLHLDPHAPTVAEFNTEGGNGYWPMPNGKDAAQDPARWRGLAELVAAEHGFTVAEWRDKPSGGHYATLRRIDAPEVAEVRAAVESAVAHLGYVVSEVRSNQTGTVTVELTHA